MTNTIARPVILVLALGVITPAPVFAQLDPLLFLKTTQPYVILAVDTAQRMQHDADNIYYDPGNYPDDNVYDSTIGLSPEEARDFYRRRYIGLKHENVAALGSQKFTATKIETVGDRQADYATFYARTRLVVARKALIQAITDNVSSAFFALVRTRQQNPQLPAAAGNDGPVKVSDLGQQSPTDLNVGTWRITRTTVAASNSTHTTPGLLTKATPTSNVTILTQLGREFGQSGALLPAGTDADGVVDAPLGLLLDDARSHANELITADAAAGGCRNTVVVLIAGGAEGTINPQNLQAKAATFRNVNGRRVPVYVIALFPTADEAAALQLVASESGGQYFEITKAMVEGALANATTANPIPPVPEAVRAVNLAVQHAFVTSTTFNTAPTAALPFGPYGEFQVTSPIVGTVNLRGASKLTAGGGTELLPDSETSISNGQTTIPQRSNVLVTSAFQLPGFDGKLRAFRVYKPVPDHTKPSGYRFTQDGSRLWENSLPPAGSRNIYTVLPGSATLVPFVGANAGVLQNYLKVADAAALIEYVRNLPMGAVVDSTPAFLDPPSLDPPPDPEYPAFREDNAERRALIFVGANDGMLHALDARTGVEVWAFIPFNLLPKLRALQAGQSLDAFKYYVDSSPKISDVRIGNEWRTYLFFGQGPGGTFYNTLDVTLDNISDTVPEDSTNEAALLAYFANQNAISWKWSFPRNTSFNASLSTYGELAPTATAAEQAIGETWSDPAIGQVENEAGPFVMVAGSGYLKHSIQSTFRTGVPRSGTTFYVFDVATGAILGTPRDVGADANAETLNDCRTINDCRRMKNALQMDPVATGPLDQRFITKVYIGDLDGRVWRFALSLNAGSVNVSAPTKLYDAGPDYPLFASMATVNVGGANQYIFVGTGSDLLPSPDAVNKPQTSKLLVLLDNGASATKTAEILLEPINGVEGEEKVTSFPAVAGDIVFFTTTTYNPTTPCTPYGANLYAFTFIGGPAYDTNNDGKLTTSSKKNSAGDSQKVFATPGARATAPFIVDQHLVFSTGDNIQMFGDPDDFNNAVGQAGVRILSWRSVR